MERKEFDQIAIGRALITDLDWASKTRDTDTASLKGLPFPKFGRF
jgi:2,4-dienoyl-CoA reductase-like NADH-dependent reductase (Old Yellow Enzyme family)